jgi:dedicator of cytokinesis protein 6/7/8
LTKFTNITIDKDLKKRETEEEEEKSKLRLMIHEAEYFHKVYKNPFHLHLQHVLFVQLTSLNLSAITKSNIKNIAIKVMLRDEDINITKLASTSKNFSPIYFRTSDNTKNKEAFALSGVRINTKTPQYFDEFRIDLPLPINKDHHLVFEFFHIDTSAKQKVSKDENQLSFTSTERIGFSGNYNIKNSC